MTVTGGPGPPESGRAATRVTLAQAGQSAVPRWRRQLRRQASLKPVSRNLKPAAHAYSGSAAARGLPGASHVPSQREGSCSRRVPPARTNVGHSHVAAQRSSQWQQTKALIFSKAVLILFTCTTVLQLTHSGVHSPWAGQAVAAQPARGLVAARIGACIMMRPLQVYPVVPKAKQKNGEFLGTGRCVRTSI